MGETAVQSPTEVPSHERDVRLISYINLLFSSVGVDSLGAISRAVRQTRTPETVLTLSPFIEILLKIQC